MGMEIGQVSDGQLCIELRQTRGPRDLADAPRFLVPYRRASGVWDRCDLRDRCWRVPGALPRSLLAGAKPLITITSSGFVRCYITAGCHTLCIIQKTNKSTLV